MPIHSKMHKISPDSNLKKISNYKILIYFSSVTAVHYVVDAPVFKN